MLNETDIFVYNANMVMGMVDVRGMDEYSCELDPQAIQRIVLKIIADHLGLTVSELHLEANLFKDLGADDLDQKELMMTIEERFGIHLKQAELSRIRRISDIILVVQKYCSEKKAMESRKYQNGIQSSRGTCKNGK